MIIATNYDIKLWEWNIKHKVVIESLFLYFYLDII